MKIRAAQPSDAKCLAAFARRTFLAAYGGDNPPQPVRQHVAHAFDDETVHRELRDAGIDYLMAFSDRSESLAGYVKLLWGQPIPELTERSPAKLERIYVDPGSQSCGLGAALLSAAVNRARQCAADAIWLSVWKENARAHAFYERNNFRRVGETFFMMGPVREEDFIYARRLSTTT